jgi:hypothetical protein
MVCTCSYCSTMKQEFLGHITDFSNLVIKFQPFLLSLNFESCVVVVNTNIHKDKWLTFIYTLLPGYNAGLRGRDLTRVIRQQRYNRRLQLFSNGLKTLLILHYWARRIFTLRARATSRLQVKWLMKQIKFNMYLGMYKHNFRKFLYFHVKQYIH